jgi:pilus assembly protein FimV
VCSSDLISAGDDVTTKLDLARAYVEMGDGETAKGLLDEVEAEGNDDQKREAGKLRERLLG